MKSWLPLTALALAQFVMVLDQAVMNVSISQLVEDFDTRSRPSRASSRSTRLVMAMFMMAGAKIGDIIGRRRAFVVGLVIYGIGSGLTAVSQSVAVLALGWSVLEGLGAALVLPALAALIAGNFEGRERATAYAIIGGVAGAGIAVGPIVGGWATTVLTWRVVFAGEVILVLVILALTALRRGLAPRGRQAQVGRPGHRPLGLAPSAPSSWASCSRGTWGFIQPTEASPITPLGFSLSIWMIVAGVGLLYCVRALAAPSRGIRPGSARAPGPCLHPGAACRPGQPALP